MKGVSQFDRSGVHGQLSAILTDADGNEGTVWTTLYGFTPTNAIVIGTEGAIQFDRNFHLPGPFTVSSADGSQTLRYEEPSGRHFEGLYYEAAEVARCITAGELETPYRTLEASLNTMATLDMIRRSVGIDFRQQAWWSSPGTTVSPTRTVASSAAGMPPLIEDYLSPPKPH